VPIECVEFRGAASVDPLVQMKENLLSRKVCTKEGWRAL
jgi:hypothetical protein